MLKYRPSFDRSSILSYVYTPNSILTNYVKLIFYAMMVSNTADSDSSDSIKSLDEREYNKFQEGV